MYQTSRRPHVARPSDPGSDEGLGPGRSGRAFPARQAGSGAGPRRGAGADRCGRNLCDRPRDHPLRFAGQHFGRPALQQEFYARPRIYGHGRGARSRRRRIRDRRARQRGNSCRLRPVQALPAGHVHLMPQLRKARERPPRQRLHDRRRLYRICRQPHQHPCPRAGQHERCRGDAGRHRRHLDVWTDGTRRTGRRRKRGRDRPRPDRPAGGCGGQGASAQAR